MWIAGPARPTPPGVSAGPTPSLTPCSPRGGCSLWGGVHRSQGVSQLTLGFAQCFGVEEGVTIEKQHSANTLLFPLLHTVQPDVQHLK